MARFLKVFPDPEMTEEEREGENDLLHMEGWVNIAHVVKIVEFPDSYGLWLIGDDLNENAKHYTKDGDWSE